MPTSESKKKSRKQRNYPARTFEQSLGLAEAIQEHASGERVNRLTLFKALDKSPTSSASQNLITNSTKYGLTKGSYVAEYLELTPEGRTLSDHRASSPAERFDTAFKCAIQSIPVFDTLYKTYKGKKLPAHEIFADTIRDNHTNVDDTKGCIDIFVVNCRYLGLLQNIAGAETLVSEEARKDEIRRESPAVEIEIDSTNASFHLPDQPSFGEVEGQTGIWAEKCFYITPIGEEGSDERKHSDLFLNYLVEPALRGLNLSVVRADQIESAGLITSQIIEHILKCRLCIVDLSFHNPNVFYEMAIRHACNRPIVQICRKRDRLPFDVNQVRTVIIDDSDTYTLIPNLESYQSEIATQATVALDGQSSNPISVFFPGTQFEMRNGG